MISDVTEQDFEREVIEASDSRPVVVDFWAPWCGPCHQLSPLLERTAGRYTDDVTLVKLNVDEAPMTARRYRVQGIPAVKAFRNGQVVSEFVGVQPEPAVEQFFAALAPSAADRLLARAEREPGRAEQLLTEALSADPGHAGALVALAQRRIDQGNPAEAQVLLERAPHDQRAQRMLAELRLSVDTRDGTDLADLEQHAASGDPQARLRYGRALVVAGRHADAVDVLLQAVSAPETRAEARVALLDVFRLLGDDHPLTRQSRPRLASALFA